MDVFQRKYLFIYGCEPRAMTGGTIFQNDMVNLMKLHHEVRIIVVQDQRSGLKCLNVIDSNIAQADSPGDVYEIVCDSMALFGLHAAIPRNRLKEILHKITLLIHCPFSFVESLFREPVVQKAFGKPITKSALTKIEAWCYSNSGKVITVSPLLIETLQKEYSTPKNRLYLLQPCITPIVQDVKNEPFPSRKDSLRLQGALKIVNVGTISNRKNQSFLLDAVAKLPKNMKVQVTFIGRSGDDKMKVQVERRAAKLRKNSNVQIFFKGETPQKESIQFVSQQDIFCFVSKQESFGMAVMEAVALGIPTIATSVGAIPQLVPEDLVIPISSSPQELADVILKVGKDLPKYKENMEKFSTKALDWRGHDKFESVLYKILDDRMEPFFSERNWSVLLLAIILISVLIYFYFFRF